MFWNIPGINKYVAIDAIQYFDIVEGYGFYSISISLKSRESIVLPVKFHTQEMAQKELVKCIQEISDIYNSQKMLYIKGESSCLADFGLS